MKHAREDYNRIQDPQNKIPKDEPVFLLRAQDRLATQAVALYASLCRKAAKAVGLSDAERLSLLDCAEKTEAHVKAMDTWPTKKYPDVPSTQTATQPSTEKPTAQSATPAK